MKFHELQDKHIGVLGMGVEGYSSALFLAKKGATVVVYDKNEKLEKPQELLDAGVSFMVGPDYLKHLTDVEMILRSPGILRNLPEIVEAETKGVKVSSQTQLFLEWCPAEVIGVTGTKGKGTTSSLIYEMLKKGGFDAYLGGNIGKPPFDFLDSLTSESKVVLELSSFQLEDTTISPHIAVMLMVTSEHLGADVVGTANYHDTVESYIEAKRNLLKFQTYDDFAVINRDYPASNESDIHTLGKVYQVSRERGVMDEGCFVANNTLYIQLKAEKGEEVDEEESQPTDGYIDREEEQHDETTQILAETPPQVSMNFTKTEIMDIGDIKLPGKHNLENVTAATMAAYLSGVSKEAIRAVLESFTGLEHRLELVAEINGVTYYDDSFSTTPETAIAAIQAFKQPEVLILGGSSKNSDFSELGSVIAKADNIRAIIGIGIEWERIKDAIMEHNVNIFMLEGAKDMTTVVTAASKIAQKGDVVLLSPACASFGMFPNYKVRGEQFKEEVKKLQK